MIHFTKVRDVKKLIWVLAFILSINPIVPASADNEPPVVYLDTAKVQPSEQFVNGLVTLTFRITDNNRIGDIVVFMLTSAPVVYVNNGFADKVSGTITDATYSITLRVPSIYHDGTWKLEIAARDAYGNSPPRVQVPFVVSGSAAAQAAEKAKSENESQTKKDVESKEAQEKPFCEARRGDLAKLGDQLLTLKSANPKMVSEVESTLIRLNNALKSPCVAEVTLSDFQREVGELMKLASKKFTITCIKGKTTKKVSGTNPKCPKGYKKK
jgi:hypothetical protein